MPEETLLNAPTRAAVIALVPSDAWCHARTARLREIRTLLRQSDPGPAALKLLRLEVLAIRKRLMKRDEWLAWARENGVVAGRSL